MKSWMGLHVIDRTEKEMHIKASKKAVYTVGIIWIAVFVVGIGLAIWGIMKQAEVEQLRQQTIIQDEQLKLLDSKTKTLEIKMKELDRLNQSILQTVSGSSGNMPGEDNKAAGQLDSNNKIKDSDEKGKENNMAKKDTSEGKAAAPGSLVEEILWRIFAVDRDVQIQLANIYSMEDILAKGGPKELQKLVSTFTVSRNALQAVPSIWPVRGVISSPYGVRTDPITGQQIFHHGIDIANDEGTPIHVTANGTVSYAGTVSGYGLCVIVTHSRGFETKYAHLSSILVKEGQRVAQGAVIGLMGSTGRSTGPHLHYEVIVNGATENPLVFLPI